MKKKILFLILLGAILVPVAFVFAAPSTDVTSLSTNVRNTFITVGGVIVVIGWIITGILYLTAAGAPDKINIAKHAVIACVIGTLLVILADATSTISGVIKSAFGLQ